MSVNDGQEPAVWGWFPICVESDSHVSLLIVKTDDGRAFNPVPETLVKSSRQ
jgi:hypothetical protein